MPTRGICLTPLGQGQTTPLQDGPWDERQTLVKTLPSLAVANDGSWLASDRACVQDAPSDRLVKSE